MRKRLQTHWMTDDVLEDAEMKCHYLVGLVGWYLLFRGPALGQAAPPQVPGKSSPSDARLLAAGYSAFGINLLKVVAAKHSAENLVLSPFDVASNLTLLGSGAREETLASFARTLSLPVDSAPRLLSPKQVALLWGEAGINAQGKTPSINGEKAPPQPLVCGEVLVAADIGFPLAQEFQASVEAFRPGSIRRLRFQEPDKASANINARIAEATRGIMKEVVAPDNFTDPNALLLVSALHLEAGWRQPFEPGRQPLAFRIGRDRQLQCPMMELERRLKMIHEPNFDLLEIPYRGERLSMLLFVPDATADLDRLLQELQPTDFTDWCKTLDAVPYERVLLQMPKFAIVGKAMSLVNTLKSMGLETAFGDKANFKGITSAGQPKTSEILHRAMIDVNEQGTRATAVTVTKVSSRSLPEPPRFQIVVDRPFLFFVRERTTNTILFLGRVVQPRGNDR